MNARLALRASAVALFLLAFSLAECAESHPGTANVNRTGAEQRGSENSTSGEVRRGETGNPENSPEQRSTDAPPETAIRTLCANPGYYEKATPAQIKALIGTHSLAGVAASEREGWRPFTPLMRAAQETPYPEVIHLLVKAGCDVNAMSEESGRYGSLSVALHFAVYNKNPAVLAALLSHKPDLNARVRTWGNTPTALELAATMPGKTEQMGLLLQAGARPDGKSEHSVWALFLGFESLDGSLYDNGVNPIGYLHYANKPRCEPAEAAAKARLLLERGVRPDHDALVRTLVSGQNEAARLLLDAGLSPTWADKEGRTLLHAALTRPDANVLNRDSGTIPGADVDMVRRLIPANGVNTGDHNGIAPLRRACMSGMSAGVARLLVQSGATYQIEGNGLMLDAVRSPNDCDDLVAYLLALGFSANDKGAAQETPLRTTSDVPKKPRTALILVKAGADPKELKGSLDRTFAVEAGILDKDGKELVTSPGPSNNDEQRMAREKAALLAEARKNPAEAIYQSQFYAVADPPQVAEIIGGRSLIGVREVVEEVPVYNVPTPATRAALPFLIFTRSFWTGTKTVTHEYSPLVEAAAVTPYPEVIHMLVKAGCKVTDMRSEPLRASLRNPSPAVLEAILGYGPDLNAAFAPPLCSPLHYLAMTEPAEFKKEHFHLLLKAGANPNVVCDDNTPLFSAARYQNTEAGRMLIAAGADVGYLNRYGSDPLESAINYEAWDLALALVQAGAPPHSESRRHSSLVYLAGKKSPPPALVRALVQAVGAHTPEAGLALTTAAENGNTEMVHILTKAGVARSDRK